MSLVFKKLIGKNALKGKHIFIRNTFINRQLLETDLRANKQKINPLGFLSCQNLLICTVTNEKICRGL